MSDKPEQVGHAKIWEIIDDLRNAISELPELLGLLTAPLETLALLPPQYNRYISKRLPKDEIKISKHIPPLQRALLEHVIPVWEAALREKRLYGLVEQYFCPEPSFRSVPGAEELAIHAYSTLLSLPLVEYSVHFLVQLSQAYPVDAVWSSIFLSPSRRFGHGNLTWEDCVRDMSAIPSKVANALGETSNYPSELEPGAYFNNLSCRFEILVEKLSSVRILGK